MLTVPKDGAFRTFFIVGDVVSTLMLSVFPINDIPLYGSNCCYSVESWWFASILIVNSFAI